MLCCIPGGHAASATPQNARRAPSEAQGGSPVAASSGEMLTSESLDLALASSAEVWGLLQPYEHLISSRTANGKLILA